jgi:molybdate transport repressor ModE-like protein
MPLPQPLPDVASLDLLKSVAELGSIRQASLLHNISQPAASTRIRSLERSLGLRLLERQSGGSRLTDEGTAVVQWSAVLLEAMRTLVSGTAALRHGSGTHLHLAASMTVAEYLVPSWLNRLRTLDPTISVSLVMGNSEDVVELVRRHRAALGFIEGQRAPKDLSSRVVGHDDLVVIVAPSHKWARRTAITAKELAATPLILRESGSGTREVLEAGLQHLGLQVTALVELGSTTAIKSAVQSGDGPAVVSRLAATNEVAEGKLIVVPVDDVELGRRIRAVWSKAVPLPPTARTLLSVVAGSPRSRVLPR